MDGWIQAGICMDPCTHSTIVCCLSTVNVCQVSICRHHHADVDASTSSRHVHAMATPSATPSLSINSTAPADLDRSSPHLPSYQKDIMSRHPVPRLGSMEKDRKLSSGQEDRDDLPTDPADYNAPTAPRLIPPHVQTPHQPRPVHRQSHPHQEKQQQQQPAQTWQ
jgi:hypothetical protein